MDDERWIEAVHEAVRTPLIRRFPPELRSLAEDDADLADALDAALPRRQARHFHAAGIRHQDARQLIGVPFRIFTGSIPPASVPVEVASQLAWTAVLVLAGRMLLARSVRRVVVQGG